MPQWYLSYNGNQHGPFDLARAFDLARNDSNGFAWREDFAEWQPIATIRELMAAPETHPAGVPLPPPMPGQQAHEIDYKVIGNEMQFVEIELDAGESAIAEAGAMMYKEAPIQMQTIFGDGSGSSGQGQGKGHVAFGAPYPGNIIPVHLKEIGGTLIAKKTVFCAPRKGWLSASIFNEKF